MGAAEPVDVGLRWGGACGVTASAYRQGAFERLIIHLLAREPQAVVSSDATAMMRRVFVQFPDGVVVTDAHLRIVALNAAFLKMAHLVGGSQAVGDPLSKWLGRSATEANMIASNLKSYGVVRNFATVLHDSVGAEDEVELSAAATSYGEGLLFGFSVRNVARRMAIRARGDPEQSHVIDEVADQVGRRPLREIVRDATDLIEKRCIEEALEIAGDNRASAAEILGLSRQGLYSKLRRFGIDEAE